LIREKEIKEGLVLIETPMDKGYEGKKEKSRLKSIFKKKIVSVKLTEDGLKNKNAIYKRISFTLLTSCCLHSLILMLVSYSDYNNPF